LYDGLSLLRDDHHCVYFLCTQPIASHAVDDKVGRNLCLARCALHGLAPTAPLARACALNPRTVARAQARLQARGEGNFVPPRKARRLHGIEDPAVLAKAAELLRAGHSLYRVAKQLGVSSSTLWSYTRKGVLPASQCPPKRSTEAAEDVAPSPAGGHGESASPPLPPPESAAAVESAAAAEAAAESVLGGQAERNRRDAQAVLGRAAHDSAGRVAASLGMLNGRTPECAPAEAVSGAGVLTALPALLSQGLLRHAGLLARPQGFYGLGALLLLWAFLLLGRVRNVERLRYQQPGAWGALLGLDRCPCPRTLRRRTRQLADCPGLPDWIGALARDWSAAAPEAVATLFVAGHVQVYSGQGRLAKHFVTRQRLALPAAVSYWLQALGGAPLLCLHRQVDDGMVREIWSGIVPQLRQLGLLPERAGADSAPRLTLVFDRQGWSPQLFGELRKAGIAVVSWRKGAQSQRWPQSEFGAASIPLRTPLGEAVAEGRLAERAVDLGAGCQAREIRFWIDRRLRGTGKGGQARQPRQLAGAPSDTQRQPALVTTHPSLAAEQAAGLLRSRWTQENDCKHMRAEFGLASLAEHALVPVEDDSWVVNPAWRALNKALKQARNKVGHLRRKRALEPSAKTARARQLDEQIEACEELVQGFELARKATDEHMRAGDLSEPEKLQALPAPLRQLMQTLRMLAYRAETCMAAELAPELDNPETARSLLKALFQSDASLLPDPAAGTLTVRLLHPASRAQDAALAPLLAELNRTRTVFPGTQLRLVYEFPSSDDSQPLASQPRPSGASAQSRDNLNRTV
jgi:hypothetical protein